MARQRMAFLVFAAVIVAATAGCDPGGAKTGEEQPDVATLQTATAASPSRSASPTVEAPRFRLDDTDADRAAKMKPYDDCLKQHGLDVIAIRQKRKPPLGDAAREAANKACEPLNPLPPWEEDPANPKARDFTYAVVKCLRAKGVDVELSPDGASYGYRGTPDDPGDVEKGMSLALVCRREVAKTDY
ncbi:hypothetical protein [Micromonospora sp. NPDC049107]|uniref:hypothetical protein n=1 Tax=Micromonospora sp. NPDC049107 TaxID=3154349 RepID=UPI0033D10110